MHFRICPLRGGFLLALSSLASAAVAADVPHDWVPVGAMVLNAARGGFTLPSGLAVGFGIERTVAINGDMVTHTRFVVPDLRLLSSEQARQTHEALSSVTLVRNGANSVNGLGQAALAGTVGATIIQNSLNDQHIQTRTVIDASVNSLAGFKAINFQTSLGDALARAAGPR
jgi:hypothetical protein